MSRKKSHKVSKIRKKSCKNSNEIINLLLKELKAWNSSSNGIDFAQFLSMFNEKVNKGMPDAALPYLLDHVKRFAQSEEAKSIISSEGSMSDHEIDRLVSNCQRNVRKKLLAKGLDSKTIDNECGKAFAKLKAELNESSKRQVEVQERLLEFFITQYEELYNETVEKYEKLLRAKDEDINMYISDSQKKDQMIDILKHRLALFQLGRGAVPPKRHRYSTVIIEIAILSYVYAKCSFRGVVKIIEIIQSVVCDLNPERELKKAPTHVAVKKWLSKTGYSIYRDNPKEWMLREGYYIIFDESISVGSQSLLLILAVPTMLKKQGPLKSTDVTIVYMKSADSWEHENVEAAINEVIAYLGKRPDYGVSDNGKNLNKAMEVLGIPRHKDISHTFANHLESVYEKSPDFIAFCKVCGETRSNYLGKNGYLMSPSARTKARFMNIFIPVFWAFTVLDNYYKFKPTERKAYRRIFKFAYLVDELMEIETAFNAIFKVIKHKGLSTETCDLCKRIIQMALFAGTPRQREVASLIIKYFDEEMVIVKKEEQQRLEAGEKDFEVVHELSSDIIESLFGTMKRIMPASKFFGLTDQCLTLNIYTLIGNPSDIITLDIYKRFGETRCTDVDIWKKSGYIAPSLLSKRKEILNTDKPKIEYVA